MTDRPALEPALHRPDPTPLHPRHPDQVSGSKWSAVDPAPRELHWEVVQFARKQGRVTLRAVLTGRTVVAPWRELRDRSRWTPGWLPCPGEAS